MLSCLLTISQCQNLLLQRALPGRVSHHSKTVTDGTSTVHRHHTQTTSPRLQLAAVHQEPTFVTAAVREEEPVLLQHADGRFFALNANLQPGQYFQTADGRIFTLAATDNIQNNEQLISRNVASEQPAVEEEENTDETVDDVIARQAENSRLSTTSLLDQNVAAQQLRTPQFRIVPANAQDTQFRFAPASAASVAHVAHEEHSLFDSPALFSRATAAPALVRTAAPTLVRTAAPAFVRTAAPVAHTFGHVTAAAPAVLRTTAHHGHLLADSSTPVFQGYYSFPNAGIDFNF